MHSSESITLTRSCEAVEIPAGIPHTLPAGAVVRLMQELGGSYTVIADSGRMYRVDAQDADALGFSAKTEQASSPQGELNEKMVWDQLKTVYDPEIPVNVADLGLIYSCVIGPQEKGGKLVDEDIGVDLRVLEDGNRRDPSGAASLGRVAHREGRAFITGDPRRMPVLGVDEIGEALLVSPEAVVEARRSEVDAGRLLIDCSCGGRPQDSRRRHKSRKDAEDP